MRHDAAKFREHEKSERIRHGLGIETPAEALAREKAEKRRKEIQDQKNNQGPALFPEE